MAEKIAEFENQMNLDLKKGSNLNIRWQHGISKDVVEEVPFKTAVDLKRGDKVKITIEKV